MGALGAIAGALIRAKVINLEGGPPCIAMFNPKELSVEKTVSWTPKDAHSEDITMEFKEPQSSKLSVTLYFDTYEMGFDCYPLIMPLEIMAKMNDSLKRPPLCMFQYGTFIFKGVVSSVSTKYTMFLGNGMRCRAEVGLSMQSAAKAVVSQSAG